MPSLARTVTSPSHLPRFSSRVDTSGNIEFSNLGNRLSPEVRKKIDDILRDLHLLRIENPEQIIVNALRLGVTSALNMLQMMINQARKQMEQQQGLAQIENKK